MEVTVFCIRLLMNVLLLLSAQDDHIYFAQKADVTFPHIVPDKLQFFEYDTVSVYCDETDGTEWKVMRKLIETFPTNDTQWDTSTASFTLKPAFSWHSGEYWCENKKGERSQAVNITVSGDSVILESPVHPVMEGRSVTLRCRKRKSTSTSIAEFYKDGFHVKTGYRGEMTVSNVSVSDEGLYKCNISGTGESPESRLSVKGYSVPNGKTHPPQNHSPNLSTLLWIIISVLLMGLLLLVMGILPCWKVNVSGESSDVHPANVTYAVVKKQKKKKEPELARADTTSCLREEEVIYSIIKL